MSTRREQFRLIDLPKVIDARGNLTAGEFGNTIPFDVKRCFMDYQVPLVEVRGEHAHRTCHQFLTCPNWNSDAPDPATSNASYRLFNIGNESTVELLRYIEVLEQCLGKQAVMELLPLQAGDVPDSEADVSALVAAVDYAPRVSVEEGVANFVAWYRDYYAGDTA